MNAAGMSGEWLEASCATVVRNWDDGWLWETAIVKGEGVPPALVAAARAELLERAKPTGEFEYVRAVLEAVG